MKISRVKVQDKALIIKASFPEIPEKSQILSSDTKLALVEATDGSGYWKGSGT